MDEPMEDLQVLCKECHMKVHGRKFWKGWYKWVKTEMYMKYHNYILSR
jgi:hypothetical protein